MSNKYTRADLKAELYEYLKGNQPAKHGFWFIKYSLLALLIMRFIFTVWETVYFLLANTPINLFGPLFIIPFLFIAYILYNGQKAFGYLLLAGAVLRLVFFYATVYERLPQAPIREVYSFSLVSILLIQFVLSLFYIFGHRCDLFFTAYHRANLKVAADSLLKK